MREYLVTVLLAAIITYLVTPLVKDLAVKAGAVSAIRSRDVHLEPTPRWGGLAMWLSMALTLVIVNYLPLVHKSFGPEATGIFLSGTLINLRSANPLAANKWNYNFAHKYWPTSDSFICDGCYKCNQLC